ncbi:MAG: hypothetical protein M1825_004957 [Sarcosagium campestre]|nr:MAG: hypothetical protein M1825_004957 [Sarcosagium campestre]
MRLSVLTIALAIVLGSSGVQALTVRGIELESTEDGATSRTRASHIFARQVQNLSRQPPTTNNASRFLTDTTKKFLVNGTGLPLVDFDIGESYAGSLPAPSFRGDPRQLFFWFFPSRNPAATDELTVFLNGGPGCSSLAGFFQDNGPVIWQQGTFKPVKNPYSWSAMTNTVWIEFPIGTGFSRGTVTAQSETELATSFLAFYRSFVDTFAFDRPKLHLAGESYAGTYIPYIADAMFNAKDWSFNLQGSLLFDAKIANSDLHRTVPAVSFMNNWPGLFPFNTTQKSAFQTRADRCGFTDYLAKGLVFPPASALPPIPYTTGYGCASLWDDIFAAVSPLNPCFSIYQITATCPVTWDPLGYPSSFPYTPSGAQVYFDRADVKAAIHAPANVTWTQCSDENVFVFGVDLSLPPVDSILPSVIERSNRTIVAHGSLDFLLIANGSLLAIQNMTWNGSRGFQSPPSAPFIVPEHANPTVDTVAGYGTLGVTTTERGLTWLQASLAGHRFGVNAPSAAYRALEFLLGRIDSLSDDKPFSVFEPPEPRPVASQGPNEGAVLDDGNPD